MKQKRKKNQGYIIWLVTKKNQVDQWESLLLLFVGEVVPQQVAYIKALIGPILRGSPHPPSYFFPTATLFAFYCLLLLQDAMGWRYYYTHKLFLDMDIGSIFILCCHCTTIQVSRIISSNDAFTLTQLLFLFTWFILQFDYPLYHSLTWRSKIKKERWLFSDTCVWSLVTVPMLGEKVPLLHLGPKNMRSDIPPM